MRIGMHLSVDCRGISAIKIHGDEEENDGSDE